MDFVLILYAMRLNRKNENSYYKAVTRDSVMCFVFIYLKSNL